MRRVLLPALGLISLVLSPAVLEAQQIPSPFRYVEPSQSVGLFAGYLATDRGELDLGPHSAPLLGAAYTIRFSGPLSGQARIGFSPSTRTVFTRVPTPVQDSTVVLDAIEETDALLGILEGGLVFHLTGPRTWHGLAPFLVASGGLIFDFAGESAVEEDRPADAAFDFGPGFAVGIGAGADWFLTERVSVRLEVRDHLWRLTTPAAFTVAGAEATEWTNNIGLTLGAALHF